MMTNKELLDKISVLLQSQHLKGKRVWFDVLYGNARQRVLHAVRGVVVKVMGTEAVVRAINLDQYPEDLAKILSEPRSVALTALTLLPGQSNPLPKSACRMVSAPAESLKRSRT